MRLLHNPAARDDAFRRERADHIHGIGLPRAVSNNLYHSSRLKVTSRDFAQAARRSGRDVPITGTIMAGCLSSQARATASVGTTRAWAYSFKRAAVFRALSGNFERSPPVRAPPSSGLHACRPTPLSLQYSSTPSHPSG